LATNSIVRDCLISPVVSAATFLFGVGTAAPAAAVCFM
jgi:hypothetical protein